MEEQRMTKEELIEEISNILSEIEWYKVRWFYGFITETLK